MKEEGEAKAKGDEIHVKAWKKHHAESGNILKHLHDRGVKQQLMQCKVDQISLRLGIALFHPRME